MEPLVSPPAEAGLTAPSARDDFEMAFEVGPQTQSAAGSIKKPGSTSADLANVPDCDVPKGSGSPQCVVCENPRKKDSSLCAEHKKGYDVIYKAAMNPASSTNHETANPVKDEELQCDVGSQKYMFIKIFGDEKQRRKGFVQQHLAYKIISEFVRDNPSGKKRAVRKFSVNLTQYFHREGFRQDSMHEEGRWKIDEEMFVQSMKSSRGWSAEKAMNFWKTTEADPEYKDLRDNEGPQWSKLRLWLPSSLLGGDRLWNKKGTFEEKGVEDVSKPQRLDDETKKQLKEEAGKGFKRPFSAVGAPESMREVLQADALSLSGSEEKRSQYSSQELLKRSALAAGICAGEPDSASSPAKSADQPAKKQQQQSPSQQGAPQPLEDINIARSALWRSQESAWNKKDQKLIQSCKDIVLLMQKGSDDELDLMQALDDRLLVAMAYRGSNMVVSTLTEQSNKKTAKAELQELTMWITTKDDERVPCFQCSYMPEKMRGQANLTQAGFLQIYDSFMHLDRMAGLVGKAAGKGDTIATSQADSKSDGGSTAVEILKFSDFLVRHLLERHCLFQKSFI